MNEQTGKVGATLSRHAGYELSHSGATSGSRVKFLHDTLPPIILLKPHPTPVLKRYQMEQVAETLRKEGPL